MIESSFEEAFSKEWVETQITDSTNELVILRQVIPWQAIIAHLTQFYDDIGGRSGKSLRIMVALLILGRLCKIRFKFPLESGFRFAYHFHLLILHQCRQ